MEVGYVKTIKGFLLYLDGLPTVRVNDLLTSQSGNLGFVSALYEDSVEVLALTQNAVLPGEMFTPTGKPLSLPVGDFLLGRAISPLGDPLDGKKPLPKSNDNLLPLDSPAPSVSARRFIDRQLDTGIALIDTLFPIGRGQRELLMGDARSGKTSFILDLLANQKKTGVVCVYACLGKPAAEVANLLETLRENGTLSYTVLVATVSSDSAPLIFLTPQSAFTIAGYFQKKGLDVVLILDDMGNHAKIYREISLLSDKTPGREAYPGDIFYQHAHLLERAGNFTPEAGGGSITALPTIELDLTDFTTFIPTNLMSMTDGHLLFRSSLFNQGWRPAIDLFLSVSRVGAQTQERIQSELSFRLKQLLTEAESLATISSFGVELPPATQTLLRQKDILVELLKQDARTFIPKAVQTAILALPLVNFGKNRTEDFFAKYKASLLNLLQTNPKFAAFTAEVFKAKSLSDLLTKLEQISPLLEENLPKDTTLKDSDKIISPETWLPKI